jgi:hypothetical protein
VSGRFLSWSDKKDAAEFTVSSFSPHRPRDILFQHLEKGLVGVVQPPRENGGMVTVKMQPGAAVTGRMVDDNGKPQAGVDLELMILTKQWPSWLYYSPKRITTDKDGRFRVETLIPGFEFMLLDNRANSNRGRIKFGKDLRSGEVKELGHVLFKEEG